MSGKPRTVLLHARGGLRMLFFFFLGGEGGLFGREMVSQLNRPLPFECVGVLCRKR